MAQAAAMAHGKPATWKNLLYGAGVAGLTSFVNDKMVIPWDSSEAFWPVGKVLGCGLVVVLCSYMYRCFLRWIQIIQIVNKKHKKPACFRGAHYKKPLQDIKHTRMSLWPRSPYVQLWLQEKQHDMAKTMEFTIYNIPKNQMLEWMVYLDLKIGDFCWGHPVGIQIF